MITVFGLGFVGLTTALGFAHFGYKVFGVDIDENKTNIIRQGNIPFLEKGLDFALQVNLNKNFIISDSIKESVQNSDTIFFCVGTPYGENGEADLKYLFAAIDQALSNLDQNKKYLLVIKSTVPPMTTKERIVPYIEDKGFKVGEDIFLANNPEFLREGHCWEDFIYGDRIVIGCENEGADRLIKLYEPFNIPIFTVSYNTGEFIKYLSNCMLAAMISFSNEMANLADVIGHIDIKEAFKIFHMDKRWNNCNMTTYFYPGCGYGGYCLPKDTKALQAVSKRKGLEAKILENIVDLNDSMPQIIGEKIITKSLPTDRIGILGLSFKPDSDDVRDSVSAKVISALLEKGYNNIAAYDPVAINNFRTQYSIDIEYIDNLKDIVKTSDVLIILTAWEEFRELKEKCTEKILDFRYM